MPDLARAKALIQDGKAEQAWSLLAPQEYEQAGNEQYDYLLGLAALESGHPARATLAFERVLAVDPNHAGARLDMARAYYALGDYQRARAELDVVRRMHPPLAARLTIERYLAAIDNRLHGPKVKASGYLEGTLGYDSNVNAATALTSVFVPLFGVNFTLTPVSVMRSDSFMALGGGLELSYPMTSGLSLIAEGALQQRAYSHADTFAYRSSDLQVGVQHLTKQDRLSLTVGGNDYDLDNAAYRRIQSANVEWRHQLDDRTQLALFGNDARIRYVQEALRTESSDMLLYGVGALHELDAATRFVAYGSLYLGDDTATDGRIDGDRRLYGARLGAQHALSAEVDLYANLTWQKSIFGQENAIFATARRDWQYDLALGLTWRMNSAWSLRPQLAWTRNDSNIPIDEYDRYQLFVTLRRDWR